MALAPDYDDVDLDLFEAVESCNLIPLVNYLNKGSNVNQTNSKGQTPLSLAAETGHSAVAALLLKHGADANQRTADEATPLYLAARKGHSAVVHVLLQYGADVELRSNRRTPLHTAAEKGHADVVAALLTHGADVKATTQKNGSTPLHLASKRGRLDVVSLLLIHGAHVNAEARFDYGSTPLDWASLEGHVDVACILLQHGADINHKREFDGAAPIHFACGYGSVGVVRLLLDNGVDTNQVYHSGVNPRATALYIATKNQHWYIVELLWKNHSRIHGTFPLPLDRTGSLVPWMNQDANRTILCLRELDGQGETVEAQTNRKLLENWDMIVAFLWYAFCTTDHNGEPPSIADTRSLSDQEFTEAHKWMIHAASSLLIVNGMLDLLRHLWRVLSPNDDAALAVSEHTGMTPLMAALITHGSNLNDSAEKVLLEGIVFLAKKQTPNALQVRHPKTNRIPLALAIDKGVPLRVLQEMVQGWASSRTQLDPVTGLPIYLLVAAGKDTNYNVSDIYEFTREFMPDLVSSMTCARDEYLVKKDPKREEQRIDE